MKELAAEHYQGLLDVVNMDDREALRKGVQDVDGELQKLRKELRSLSYERVVTDVLSRDLLDAVPSTKRPVLVGASVTSKNVTTTPSTAKQSKTITAAWKAPDYDVHIDVEGYSSSSDEKENPKGVTVKDGKKRSQTSNRRTAAPGLTVRRSDNGLMVPSMRVGSLPLEVRNLQTKPGDFSKQAVSEKRYTRAGARKKPVAKPDSRKSASSSAAAPPASAVTASAVTFRTAPRAATR